MRRFAPDRLRSDCGDPLPNGVALRLRNCIRATEAGDLCSTQTDERLTQRAAGKNVVEAERFQGVEQHDIEIAG